MTRSDLLVRAIRDPAMLVDASAAEWDVVVRQGRAARLLARLAVGCERAGVIDRLDAGPRRHLETARLVADQQRVAVRAEVEHIRVALRRTGLPVLLLKGAAYVMANLPVAEGRVFGDIDILVPKERLPDVESALMLNGWNTTHHHAYDQRYYRQWMHEIPPMRHLHRGTVIDVHHALLPQTARIRVESMRMREAARSVSGFGDLQVLAPVDLVLHSACHLFNEGELDNGLRDLVDLDGLLRHFGAEPGFWASLVPRATEVGLGRPLYYALRYTRRMLGTPVPDRVVLDAAPLAAGPLLRPLMDALLLRALDAKHSTAADHWTPIARWMLYLRGHWLRMPLPLLAVHLARKAFIREPASTSEKSNDPQHALPGDPR